DFERTLVLAYSVEHSHELHPLIGGGWIRTALEAPAFNGPGPTAWSWVSAASAVCIDCGRHLNFLGNAHLGHCSRRRKSVSKLLGQSLTVVELPRGPANLETDVVTGLGNDVEVNVEHGLMSRRAIILKNV